MRQFFCPQQKLSRQDLHITASLTSFFSVTSKSDVAPRLRNLQNVALANYQKNLPN